MRASGTNERAAPRAPGGLIAVQAPPLDVERDTAADRIVGSQVGSREFVRAMLRFLPPGRVALVTPDSVAGSTARDLRRLQDNEDGHFLSAQVVAMSQLPALIEDGTIGAMHDVEGVGLHKAAYLRARYAARPHPITSLTYGLSPQPLLWRDFARLAITPTLPCDSVLCLSEAAREALRRALEHARDGFRRAGVAMPPRPLRLDVVPLGVDHELFCPGDKCGARHVLGLPQSAVIVLYFGRLDHMTKGDLGPLIMALPRLASCSNQKLLLLLAGGLPSSMAREHLMTMFARSGCGDQVLLREAPRPTEAPLYYRAADVFVSPVDTLQESFGIAPLEAMSSGLPAVVSGWSGYRETVLHGVTGFHAPCYWADCTGDIDELSPMNDWSVDHLLLAQSVAVDVERLVSWLAQLIGNQGLRSQMSEAARNHVVSNYSWPVVMRRAHDLWEELKAVASAMDARSAVPYLVERSRYYEVFSQYPDSVLSGSETVRLTDVGRALSDPRSGIHLPPGMEFYLDVAPLRFVLRVVRLLGRFGVRASIGELADRLTRRFGIARPRALRHILWLLKYDALSVASRTGGVDPVPVPAAQTAASGPTPPQAPSP